jgi:hypothetical protein
MHLVMPAVCHCLLVYALGTPPELSYLPLLCLVPYKDYQQMQWMDTCSTLATNYTGHHHPPNEELFFKLEILVGVQYLVLILLDFTQNTRRPIIFIVDVLSIGAVDYGKNLVYPCT